MGKKCEKCGAELKDGAKFCTSCGAPVPDESEPAVEEKKIYIPKKKIVIATAVIAVVVIGGGIVAYTKMLSKPESSGQTVKNESAQKNESKSEKSKVTKTEEKTPSYRYQWTVKPEIEADQIYYATEAYGDYNDYHRQSMNAYAIIEKDGLKGLVDSYGVLRTAIQYENIIAVDDDTYRLRDQQGKEYTFTTYEEDGLFPYEKEEEIDDVDSAGTDGLTDNTDWAGYYYYAGEVHNAHISDNYASDNCYSLIGIQQSSEELWSLAEWKNLEGKYAIYNNNALITDFVYDACGSSGDNELIAVCRDGKWGYVNVDGQEVIPTSFDTTWNRYTSNEMDAENVEANTGTGEFCYASANGYVPLRLENEWRLENTEGMLVISPGEFDEILPVNSYDRCWVKKDGKWGVIKITDEEVDSNENEEWKQRAVDWVKEKYAEDNGRTFVLFDINGDHIPEIAAIGTDVNPEGKLGTFAADKTSEVEIEGKELIYVASGNILNNSSSDNDEHYDDLYAVYNGGWNNIASGIYYDSGEGEWYDAQNGYQNVSAEEYAEKKNSLIDPKGAESIVQNSVTVKEIIQQIQDYK